MQFNIAYDSSVGSAPSAFKSVVSTVAQWFQTTFTDNVTVNVTVGYGEVDGQALSSGALGESLTYLSGYTYGQVRGALAADASSADDISSSATLPANDPANAGAYWVSTAEAKALGLAAASTDLDGSVGFASGSFFDYDHSNGINAGQYDFYAVVAHELSEVMGRTAELGGTIGRVSHSYEPMDLFRYTSAGVRDFVSSHSAYLAPDGGITQLVFENTRSSGDFGDWAASAGNDAFLAFSNPGVVNQISNADLRVMDMIGWDLAGNNTTASHIYDTGWTLSGIGDFNGDNHADFAWVQNSTSLLNIELMNGTTEVATADLTNSPFDGSWHIKAAADFNGDGRADLVWSHDGDGLVEIQLFDGVSAVGGGLISNNPFASGWTVESAADFNGDGKADLLWQRDSDGLVEIQFLNGNSAIGGGVIASNPFGSDWKLVGTGDFNNDHTSDLVWQRPSDGLVEIQFLNGNSAIGGGVIANNPFGLGWSIAEIGDFNGDGKDDLVWQRQSDHLVEIQFLDGNQAVGGGVVANNPFDLNWSLVGAGDFNGDGYDDLVYRRSSDGLTEVQCLKGAVVIGGGVTGVNAASQAATPLDTAVDHDAYFGTPVLEAGLSADTPVTPMEPGLIAMVASAGPEGGFFQQPLLQTPQWETPGSPPHSDIGILASEVPLPFEEQPSALLGAPAAGLLGMHQWDHFA